MTPQPIIAAIAPAAGPQAYRPPSAPDDPRLRDLAEALAGLRDQAKTVRTPTALAADLLAEALLQRRYGPSIQDAAPVAAGAPQPGLALEAAPRPAQGYLVQAPAGMAPGRALTPGGAPAYAPQGRPGPLQVAPVPQSTPSPSPSPGAPAPSAPAGTANAAPAAASPAAGAALAAAYGQGDPRELQAAPFAPPQPEVLINARAAIWKGADPAKVRARLVAHGYDPRAL